MGILDGFKRDRGKEADLAWFAAHPDRRHRARRMTAREWKDLRRGYHLEAVPLQPGFRWIIVTRHLGKGEISRLPAAWSTRIKPDNLPEDKAAQLYADMVQPMKEWGEFIGFRPAGEAA